MLDSSRPYLNAAEVDCSFQGGMEGVKILIYPNHLVEILF